MIRSAKYVDIPRLVEIIESQHGKTYYAHNTAIDPVMAKQFLVQCIQRHGHINYGGCLVLVSEKAGIVEGFIIGVLDQIYPVSPALRATDLFFLLTDQAPKTDAVKMIKRVVAWGESCPKVVEVFLGVSDVLGDWLNTAKLYETLGLHQCGGLFRRELST